MKLNFLKINYIMIMFMFMFLFMAIWALDVMPWAFLYIREDMDSVHNKALSTTNLIISMVVQFLA